MLILFLISTPAIAAENVSIVLFCPGVQVMGTWALLCILNVYL